MQPWSPEGQLGQAVDITDRNVRVLLKTPVRLINEEFIIKARMKNI